jgi:hypothetical protein
MLVNPKEATQVKAARCFKKRHFEGEAEKK